MPNECQVNAKWMPSECQVNVEWISAPEKTYSTTPGYHVYYWFIRLSAKRFDPSLTDFDYSGKSIVI